MSGPTISIGKLARKSGLSRSTLLYYDSIGLLKPSVRSESRYRLYSVEDQKHLEQICMYRQMGIPLREIKTLLKASGGHAAGILENQLDQLSEQIRILRERQYAIVRLLKSRDLMKKAGVIDKQAWIEILKSSGMSKEDMQRWHEEFEKMSPQAHHDFLSALGLEEMEIREIRQSSRKIVKTV
ncbi:MerR family transcriptional regulator [bacterium]|nr:MerR family transcriptional regulator [bacterium]